MQGFLVVPKVFYRCRGAIKVVKSMMLTRATRIA